MQPSTPDNDTLDNVKRQTYRSKFIGFQNLKYLTNSFTGAILAQDSEVKVCRYNNSCLFNECRTTNHPLIIIHYIANSISHNHITKYSIVQISTPTVISLLKTTNSRVGIVNNVIVIINNTLNRYSTIPIIMTPTIHIIYKTMR